MLFPTIAWRSKVELLLEIFQRNLLQDKSKKNDWKKWRDKQKQMEELNPPFKA
jgi:hypothetical protein